jgi:hypothetical protein
MVTVNNLDDYRHKLVDKILAAESYEQIKLFLLTAVKSMKEHDVHEHLISRVIDKTLNQLHGISLLGEDVKRELNIRYAKSQLALIKRERENKTNNV